MTRRAAALLLAYALPCAGQDGQRGAELFTTAAQPPCALCHTLRAAGAEGAIGPSLDELKPDAARVLQAMRTGVGAMPSYADKLSEAELRALARYVATAAR